MHSCVTRKLPLAVRSTLPSTVASPPTRRTRKAPVSAILSATAATAGLVIHHPEVPMKMPTKSSVSSTKRTEGRASSPRQAGALRGFSASVSRPRARCIQKKT
jgi:hypothetical protein